MKLILWELFFSSFLASVANNQPGESMSQNYNSDYMKESVIIQEKANLARRSPETKAISFQGELNGVHSLKSIHEPQNFITDKNPIKLKKPRNIKHGTFKEVHDHLKHSLLSFCPLEDTLGYECACPEKYKYVTTHQDNDLASLAVVAVENTIKTIFVSYRPTVNTKNWVTNFNVDMCQFPGAPDQALVHKGFLNYFMTTHNSTLAEVKKLLKKPELRNYDLIITGISLGSAVATISLPFWADLLNDYNDKRKLHSFVYSGPRVGNEQFAQYIASLDIPITRYTNGNDIVPHLPPRSFGFVHVGAEIHERDNGYHGKVELQLCSQDYDEDPECGYKDSHPVSIVRHSLFLGIPYPLPPYC